MCGARRRQQRVHAGEHVHELTNGATLRQLGPQPRDDLLLADLLGLGLEVGVRVRVGVRGRVGVKKVGVRRVGVSSLLADLVVDARHGVFQHLEHQLRLGTPAPRPSLAATAAATAAAAAAAAATAAATEVKADALLSLAGCRSARWLGQQLHLLCDLAEEQRVLAETLHRLDEVVEEGDDARGGRAALQKVSLTDLLLRLRDRNVAWP